MDTETVFAGTFLIVMVLLIVLTWKNFPYAKFIVISRNDTDAKYVAIQDIEVIDNHGRKLDIISLEGKNQLITGFANATSAFTSITSGATPPVGDIRFDGKNLGYVKDNGFAASVGTPIGPLVGFIPGNVASGAYMIFSLGCSARIARVNIRAVNDDTSRLNLQQVKIYLLDKDKNIIKGAEQIIPMSGTIPQSTHHISFV